MRQHGADELVDPELGGLEVHVDIHEGGGEGRAAYIDCLVCLARAPTRDGAVCNGKIRRHPLSCAGDEDGAPWIRRSAGSSPRETARTRGLPRRGGLGASHCGIHR